MSASLHYQPVNGTYLDVGGAKSAFIELLGRLGMTLPCEIDGAWLPMLSGAAKGVENPDHRHALDVLIDAVETHGTIRVWAEY